MQQNLEPSGNTHPSTAINPLAVYISLIPLLLTLWDYPGQDIRVYWNAASSLVKGQIPYLDFPLEYPPYAILNWLIPILGTSLEFFKLAFAVQILALDAAFKFILLGKGLAAGKTFDRYFPFICFSISAIALRSLYLQRMDLVPALLSVITVMAFAKARYVAAGVILSIAAGMKLYPALFFIPLLALASRKNNARKFLLGAIIGALPILISTPFVPWLKFLDMHLARGLQVESTYASFIWLAGKVYPLDLKWVQTPYCHELAGEVLRHYLPYFQFIFVFATLSTVIHISHLIWSNSEKDYTLPEIARIALLVLFPFVLFNKVFSPQYLIWLNTIAVIAFPVQSHIRQLYFMMLITALTPIFYPSAEYHAGLSLPQTIVLALRNASLIILWLTMYREFVKQCALSQSLNSR